MGNAIAFLCGGASDISGVWCFGVRMMWLVRRRGKRVSGLGFVGRETVQHEITRHLYFILLY